MASTRRQLLIAAAVAGLGGQARAADSRNIPKERARYQDEPLGRQYCESCTYFVQPNACLVVAGEISPRGWCRFFEI